MTIPLHSSKTALRQQIRARLNALTSAQCGAAAREICFRLRQQPIWHSTMSVLFFAPLATEPDIWPLLAEALLAGKSVALPRFSPVTQSYVACAVRDLDADLCEGRFGIREPVDACAELPLNRLDLTLVPGVAFDSSGHRLGRGKGFYDRMLASIHGTKCGIAFDEQIIAAIPVGPLDISVNCILTPTRWIET